MLIFFPVPEWGTEITGNKKISKTCGKQRKFFVE
jgi:hypothetical protein